MKGLSMKKIIIGIILVVVVWLVALFTVRKISYGVIMGEAKDVSDYYEFELDDVEKIVTERYANDDSMITQYFYNEDGVCVAKLPLGEDGYCSYADIYDEYGSLVVHFNTYGEFAVENIYEYEYDDDDNVIREKCYGPDGEPWRYIDYKYDKEGNVKKKTYRRDELADIIKPDVAKNINKYDDGNLVEVREKGAYTGEHTRELEYDRDGNIVLDMYWEDNVCPSCYKKAYEYDDDGNVVKEEIYTHRGQEINISYIYDSKGDLVEEYLKSDNEEERLYRTYATEYVGKDVTITFEEVEAYEGATRWVAVVEFD